MLPNYSAFTIISVFIIRQRCELASASPTIVTCTITNVQRLQQITEAPTDAFDLQLFKTARAGGEGGGGGVGWGVGWGWGGEQHSGNSLTNLGENVEGPH